jgi:hypothetical protein
VKDGGGAGVEALGYSLGKKGRIWYNGAGRMKKGWVFPPYLVWPSMHEGGMKDGQI